MVALIYLIYNTENCPHQKHSNMELQEAKQICSSPKFTVNNWVTRLGDAILLLMDASPGATLPQGNTHCCYSNLIQHPVNNWASSRIYFIYTL